jgi:hypothetical protein
MKYEQIFNQYNTTGSNHKFFNILKTINFPDGLPQNITSNYTVVGNVPFSVLSYKIYGTTSLWWLICLVNKIDNPVKLIDPGTTIKIIKPGAIDSVINQIQSKL